MKNIRLILLLLLAAVLTCSCGVGDAARSAVDYVKSEIDLVRDEWDDIVEFYGYEPTPTDKVVTPMANYTDTDTEAEPTLVTQRHIEIVESAYNSASRTVIFSSGNVDLSDKSGLLDEADVRGYTRVDRPRNKSVTVFQSALAEAGIEYTTVVKKNPAPAGEVFALEFAGTSDSAAYYINKATAVTLYVSAEKVAETAEPGDMTVYITYDDGPSAKSTLQLLDVLDTYGVKATFFTLGSAIEKNPELARQIADRGHVLASHSVTHEYEEIYSSTDALAAEVLEWEKIVADAGITLSSKLFRFPGGTVSKYLTDAAAEDMKSRLGSMGYAVYDWNVVSNDSLLYMREDGESVHDYIKRNFIETFEYALREREKKDAPMIILLHEGVEETVDLMPWMIEYLMKNGYKFGSLTDLESSWTFADRKTE